MIEIDTSILISAIALIVSFIFSFTSFYYLQLQGAKFRIEHISKNLQPNSTYEHIITIVNIGNKTGVLKGIQPITSSKKAWVERPNVDIIWGHNTTSIHEKPPYAVVAVGAKESIVIKCYVAIIDRTNKRIIPKYKIKLTLDKKTKFDYDEKDKFLDVGYEF